MAPQGVTGPFAQNETTMLSVWCMVFPYEIQYVMHISCMNYAQSSGSETFHRALKMDEPDVLYLVR